MEAEQENISSAIKTDQDLKQIIVATYRGQNNEIIKQAQNILAQSFRDYAFVQRLAKLISNCTLQQKDIKKAAASLLKNYSFEKCQSQGANPNFIEILYNLTMLEELETSSKQLLGMALEYQFNRAQSAYYKQTIKQKILLRFANQEAIAVYDSCIIIFQAYCNSIVGQPEEKIDFFSEIIQPVSAAALQIYELILKMPNDKWLASKSIIVPKLSILFQFLASALEDLFDQNDDLAIFFIRQNQFLINLFESYLLLFHNNHSIVSVTQPQTNKIKSTMTNAIRIFYADTQYPSKMLHIIFFTIILQDKNVVEDKVIESILVNCIAIVESHLQTYYIGLFDQNRLQFMFSLLMHCVSNSQEYGWIQNQPQVFVQLAEEFTEGIGGSYHLKVNAASALELFVRRMSNALNSIVQIIMIIMSESIGAQDPNSELIKNVQAQFSRFSFYRLSFQQKLQTCLMVLCVLSNEINERQDMSKAIYSFFLTNFQAISNIQSPIIILRIMRTISYYPSALYFMYIQMQMNKGKVFILEGIKSLERILRTNKFPQLFQFLSSIFAKIMKVVKIQDPVVELIVINYYEKMLKKNPELYAAFRLKIKEQFYANMYKNQHATIICLNLIDSLIYNQQNPNILSLLQKQFYQISAFIEQQQQKQLYDTYEYKLIEIYQAIIHKFGSVKCEIQRFAVNTLKYLHQKEKGSQIFRFYNSCLIKLNGNPILYNFFQAFWQEIKQRFKEYLDGKQSLNSFAYFCFLISQLIAQNCNYAFSEQDLLKLMQMGEKLPIDQKQYPIIIFLTLLYVNPNKILTFLKKYNIYDIFLNQMPKIKYEDMILKKIFNLAYIHILDFETNPQITKRIIIQCIKNLKEVKSYAIKDTQYKTIEIKPRRYNEDRTTVPQVQFRRGDQNELINLLVKFKHPLDNVCEFNQFKIKCWSNEYTFLKELKQPIKSDLRLIMEVQMVDNRKARVIRKIKK